MSNDSTPNRRAKDPTLFQSIDKEDEYLWFSTPQNLKVGVVLRAVESAGKFTVIHEYDEIPEGVKFLTPYDNILEKRQNDVYLNGTPKSLHPFWPVY
jgi:hypothetical protein